MKKSLSIVLSLLFFGQALFAQYRTMLENGSTWYSYYEGLAFSNTRLSVEGDSLIGGKLYKVVNYYDDGSPNLSYREHFREDTLTKQVFQHYPIIGIDTIELLTFDFSLSVGDTVTVYDEPSIAYTLVLDSISTVLPYDCFDCEMPPEVYFATPSVFYLDRIDCPACGPVVWLEGVGSLTEPLQSNSGIPMPGPFDLSILLCHYSGIDVLDYRFFHPEEQFPCQGPLSSINEPPSQAKLSVYPNPSSRTVTIKSEEVIQTVEIYDLYGSLQRFDSTSSAHEVDISALSNGLLIFRITTRTGQTYVKKVVKQDH